MDEEERVAKWAIGGALVACKLVTTALILIYAPGSTRTIIWLFLLLHWPFILAGVIVVAAPLAFRLRLIRVRAKRARLQAEEWEINAPRASRGPGRLGWLLGK